MAYVTELHKLAVSVRATFEAIDPSPVAGGDDVVAAYSRAMDEAVKDLEEAEDDARSGGGEPIPELGELPNLVLLKVDMSLITLGPVGTDLQTLLDREPLLERAYRAALSCRRFPPLEAVTTSPSPTPGR